MALLDAYPTPVEELWGSAPDAVAVQSDFLKRPAACGPTPL